MRGKVQIVQRGNVGLGITPAYAGKSVPPVLIVRKFQGSPPPMRGKGADVQGGVTMFGITPAYAGKRIKETTILNESGDHPRLCGEKFQRLAT